MSGSTDIEARLMEDPHIIKIHHDPWPEIPPIEYTKLFNESAWTLAERYVNRIKNKLNQPYIEDVFGGHHDQRATWDEEMAQKYEGFWEYRLTDALRVNNWGSMKACMGLFSDLIQQGYIGPSPEELEKLTRQVLDTKCEKEYDNLSTPEKIEYVRSLRQSAYLTLVFLGEQSTISPPNKF